MRYTKDVTVLAFAVNEKKEYKDCAMAGVLALEAQVTTLDALCRWDITDVGEAIAYRNVREQRQLLITQKAKLHDFVVALG